MKKYNIPFRNSGRVIEDIIWKFPFSDSAREMREKAVDGEKIFEIELAPFTPYLLSVPHMIAITSGRMRKSLLKHEKVYKDYDTARQQYIKEEFTVGFADIFPVWKVNELDTHGKITVYESKIEAK